MLTRTHWFASLIGLMLGAPCAQADDLSDLEKLQRQIDAAKAAKQSKPAAAPTPRHKATQAPPQAVKAPAQVPQESMTRLRSGILRQNATGLLWTATDNGADIDWD